MVSSNPERTPFEWVSHETKGFPTWVTETFSGYTSKTISEEEISVVTSSKICERLYAA